MRRLFAVLIPLLSFSYALSATVILPAEFREIVSGSQIILHGRVTDVRSDWVDGGSRIETLVTVEPATWYKGTPLPAVTFRTPGGQVGRYRSITVGAPAFRVGEEAVLFLKSQGPAIPRVFGLNQGVFRVRVDARTGRRLVIRHALIAPAAGAARVARGDRDRRPLTLDAFGAQVRAALQGGAQ
jgi:hypothetical protein